jgi:hypothetical protein
MAGRSVAARSGVWMLALTAVCGVGCQSTHQTVAQATPKYSFDNELAGFAAWRMDGFEGTEDTESSVEIVRDGAKVGAGALLYSYQVKPQPILSLASITGVPAGTESVDFWMRSDTSTQFYLYLAEEDASTYLLPFHLPSQKWTRVTANLDEFVLSDTATDENGKLDLAQVAEIGFYDLATIRLGAPENLAYVVPNRQGSRKIWLDDLEFSEKRVPQARGVVKTDTGSALVVDNFDAGLIRWMPVKWVVGEGSKYEYCPDNISLQVLADGAGLGGAKSPAAPGGRVLRFTYRRNTDEGYAVYLQLEKQDLSRAERLLLDLRMSRKSKVLLQVNENDGTEYRTTLPSNGGTGWQSVDVALSDFTVNEDCCQDENNALDVPQINAIAIKDVSSHAGYSGVDVTMDLDAVRFTLK